MTLDTEKIKAAALAAKEYGIGCLASLADFDEYATPAAVLELITRLEAAEADRAEFQKVIIAIGNAATGYDFSGGLAGYVSGMQERMEAAESELNVCSIEYGDVRNSYIHYKEKYEAAEKGAALYRDLINQVARKFPNESRHETAFRYIKQAEAPSYAKVAMKESEK